MISFCHAFRLRIVGAFVLSEGKIVGAPVGGGVGCANADGSNCSAKLAAAITRRTLALQSNMLKEAIYQNTRTRTAIRAACSQNNMPMRHSELAARAVPLRGEAAGRAC
jgi:hypothetical protein